MAIVIVHISDVHIKTNRDPIVRRGSAIAAACFPSIPSASHVFVVCSGDVAYSGSQEEYDAAIELFDGIRTTLQSETNCPVSFVFAPGNHDCNFSFDTGARKSLVSSLERSDGTGVDKSIIDICTSIQNSFFSFRNSLETNSEIEDDKLWRTHRFDVEGKSIVFDCLNVSWMSKIREDSGRLIFPVDRYSNNEFDHADLRVVVMHHPLNWFSQGVYRPFRTFVRKLADIVVTGHEHQGTVGIIDDAESDKSAYIEGSVLQSDTNSLTDSSFNVAVIDLVRGQFATTRFSWDGSIYAATEEGSWSDFRDLPAKRSNTFEVSAEFVARLDDPGAFFKHPSGVNVTLPDVFVYPDLRKMENGNIHGKTRIFINSRRLLAPEETADGVLLEGGEKSGCTSLLYQLYREYHDRGFIPVYLSGKDIKRFSDSDLNKAVERAVENQYGKEFSETFRQTSRTQKLVLLDDFDSNQIRAGSARAGILCSLKQRFAHVVVAVGEMFEIREMLDADTARALGSLTHYKIQPFGHVLREKLISRWLTLGADETCDEGTFIARVDQAEKLVTSVMQKSVIPSIPLYLLTLLQSMDAGRSGDFKDSALGYYYQYLLTESLQTAGVKADKLTEHFQYAVQLAWAFHQLGKRDITEHELRDFNNEFSKEWHTVDFDSRVRLLLKARILSLSGDDYTFRYPYIYYYLKGKYLSENLADASVRDYIEHCCQHLYVRDHANTVLFLAHHSNNDFILSSISGALQSLFCSKAPVRFDGDTDGVSRLISEAPTFTYSGGSPKENRVRRNEIRDELDDGHDGLLDSEEDSAELSLIAQMTMLFKTTEILGQVLKNQYSRIQRSRKSSLIEDLFNGPLRAARDFYDFYEKNPDALAAEIETALKRRGRIANDVERREFSKKVAASLLQMVTFSFLLRAAQGASSEDLKEDVHSVVERVGTPAFRLIELGILLDSPKPIPRRVLADIYKDVRKDAVASRIVQFMVLNRLYMFKTTEQDMQWISQELSIDLSTQHAITYQEKRQRLIH